VNVSIKSVPLCLWAATLAIAVTFQPIRVAADELSESQTSSNQEAIVDDDDDRSIPYRILVYVPNRVLDLLDIFRVRARVGPGFGVGVRATEAISAELTSYATLYAGLPGPRQDRIIRSPLGLELYSSAGLSFFSIKTKDYGPHFSPTEFGIDLQLAVAGASIGIDPVEILDFITGFVGVEIVEDDL
jgi:hypothetical protein